MRRKAQTIAGWRRGILLPHIRRGEYAAASAYNTRQTGGGAGNGRPAGAAAGRRSGGAAGRGGQVDAVAVDILLHGVKHGHQGLAPLGRV